MSLLSAALALLVLIASGPVGAAQDIDARLEAFQQFCLPHRLDPLATVAVFERAGWSIATEDAHPELPALIRLDREQAAAGEAVSETVTLQGEVQGEVLFATGNTLTAEISEDETARYSTCAIWDFDAAAPIPDDRISAWTSISPVVRLDSPAVGRIVQWNMSASLPGAGNLQTSYFPDGSPLLARTGFTGAAIFLTSDLAATP